MTTKNAPTVQGESGLRLFISSCRPTTSSTDMTANPTPRSRQKRCMESACRPGALATKNVSTAANKRIAALNQVPKLSSSSRSKMAICQYSKPSASFPAQRVVEVRLHGKQMRRHQDRHGGEEPEGGSLGVEIWRESNFHRSWVESGFSFVAKQVFATPGIARRKLAVLAGPQVQCTTL